MIQINRRYGGGEIPINMPDEATARDRQRFLDDLDGRAMWGDQRECEVVRIETREVTPWERAADDHDENRLRNLPREW